MVGVECHCGYAGTVGELYSQSFQYDKAGLRYAMSSKSSHAIPPPAPTFLMRA